MSVEMKKFKYVKFQDKYLLPEDIVVTTVEEVLWMKNELKKLKLLLEQHLEKELNN